MTKAKYELESGALAMWVYRGDRTVAAAMSGTHGGWAIYIGSEDAVFAGDPVAVADTRVEAIKWLEDRFPGVQKAYEDI